MKKSLFLLVLMYSMSMFSQVSIDTVHSEKLDEDRIIKIALPPNYAKNKDKKYFIRNFNFFKYNIVESKIKNNY